MKKYRCKHCNGAQFRAPVEQTVDVQLDSDGHFEDIGLDFSLPEIDKDRIYCDRCGEPIR